MRPETIVAVVLVTVVVIMFVVMSGHASQDSEWGCLPHDEAVLSLSRDFGEEPVAIADTFPTNRRAEIFVSRNGNWTILTTGLGPSPDGDLIDLSCKMARGSNWRWYPRFHPGELS